MLYYPPDHLHFSFKSLSSNIPVSWLLKKVKASSLKKKKYLFCILLPKYFTVGFYSDSKCQWNKADLKLVCII